MGIEDWDYEAPDYEVGLSGGWNHEACTVEYEQGVMWDTDRCGPEVNGYADFRNTLECLDCGVKFEFVHPEFVGFDEREIPNYDGDFE